MYDPHSAPLVSFSQARALFVAGEDTPRALLERCLEAIETREPELQAFVRLDVAGARDAADAATERYRSGRPLSEVDGCPVGVKDIINTADLPTEMNSRIYRGWQPGWDAACVYALRKGGAVIVGKTVTTEFACGDPGPTRNPFDAARTPGGSSSGSAAAVGAGMLPTALGTQTRASTIRPASYCGAYGFKPSYGALNLHGVHPVAPSLDHLGVIAGSLDDCWRIAAHISAIVGGGPGAPGLAGPPTPPSPETPNTIAWLKTPGWAETDEASKHAFKALLSRVQIYGVEVVSAGSDRNISNFDKSLERTDELAREIAAFEMRSPMASYREQHPEKLGSTIRAYLALSDQLTIEDHRERLRRQATLRAAVAELDGIDFFITLASSGPAPAGLSSTGSRNFISPWTLIGGPSVSLPLLVSEGMPLGVQIMGLPNKDVPTVAFARWLADATLLSEG